jgi:prepilin-type N-terminal cleavage/methylation domain-containing protein
VSARRGFTLLECLTALGLAVLLIGTATGLMVTRTAELQDSAATVRARQALLDARERLVARLDPIPALDAPRAFRREGVTVRVRRVPPAQVDRRLRTPGLAAVVLTARWDGPDGPRTRSLTVLVDEGGRR